MTSGDIPVAILTAAARPPIPGSGNELPPGVEIVEVSGPSTRGKTITVAGRRIKLPGDAYVAGYVLHQSCAMGVECPTPPIYEITRGDSFISVDRDGRVVTERLAPDEPAAFEFMKEALR